MEHSATFLEVPSHRPSDRPAAKVTSLHDNPEVAALTRRMIQGDETAYRAFYAAYFDRLSRYLLVVTAGDEEATREALQGMLGRVVRHIRLFEEESAFWSWLTVLARSALSDHGRKRRRYLAFLDRLTLQAGIEEMGRDPHQDDRLNAALERNLAALPPEDRQLLQWKYFERRTVGEIARHCLNTEKAVESRLGRIRRDLKRALLSELKDNSHD